MLSLEMADDGLDGGPSLQGPLAATTPEVQCVNTEWSGLASAY